MYIGDSQLIMLLFLSILGISILCVVTGVCLSTRNYKLAIASGLSSVLITIVMVKGLQLYIVGLIDFIPRGLGIFEEGLLNILPYALATAVWIGLGASFWLNWRTNK